MESMNPIDEILNSMKPRPRKPDSFGGLPIRPPIKKTRLFVDNEYLEEEYAAAFPHSVTTVYCVLARHANYKNQTCFPSVKKIMELSGIKNRRTAFAAIRILEAFSIIAVIHSNGRTSNRYALLDPSVWKPVNSIKIKTVMKANKARITRTTVAVNQEQPSQKPLPNGDTDDTRNHITESYKEIKDDGLKTSTNGTGLLRRLSDMAKSVVTPCFREDDIVDALEELNANGSDVSKLNYKPVLEELLRRGAVPTKELPGWIARPP